MNSMMFMREDGQMGTCRICGKNFGLIGGYMEEFTGERLNVCVDCIKKFRQISEEDSSMVRTIVDDLISSCNNEKTLPILKKYKVKAVADSQMKEQIAIMKKREVEKTPDIIVTACDLKEDYEVVAPVYFQLSNKGVFSSTYSRLAAEYSSKLKQLKEQGMLANRKLMTVTTTMIMKTIIMTMIMTMNMTMITITVTAVTPATVATQRL